MLENKEYMVISDALKDKKPKCPECGGFDMRKFGWKFVGRVKRQQYQCQKCGRISVKPEWEDKKEGEE